MAKQNRLTSQNMLGIQHGPLELDGVRLDLVDLIRLDQPRCTPSSTSPDWPTGRASSARARPPASRQRPAAACGSSPPAAGAAAVPTCRPSSTAPSAAPARPPTAEGQHQAQQPGAQHVVESKPSAIQKASPAAITAEDQPDDQRARLPAVHKSRCAQLGGKRLWRESREPFCSSFVLESLSPWS